MALQLEKKIKARDTIAAALSNERTPVQKLHEALKQGEEAKLLPPELKTLKIGIKKGEARDTLKALEPAKRVLALEQERVEAPTTLLSAETHVQKEASLGSK